MEFIQSFRQVRNTYTPLLAIQTADQRATINRLLVDPTLKLNETMALIEWDIVRGWTNLNVDDPRKPFERLSGEQIINKILTPRGAATGPKRDPLSVFCNPVSMLREAANNFEGSVVIPGSGRQGTRIILFMHNAHRYLDGTTDQSRGVIQGILNLRDMFSRNGCLLVLLGPSFTLPTELQNDFQILDEPLPSDEEISKIIQETCQSTAATNKDFKAPDEDTVKRTANALRGLSAFAAEQALAMSLTPTGVDVDMAWDKKQRRIESTRGLGVWRGNERFGNIRGHKQLQDFLRACGAGQEPVNVIAFADELEKMFAGATSSTSDSSGVAQRNSGTILSYMEDTKSTGILLVGPPGTGKSVIAKAFGGEIGVPTIAFRMSEMLGSLVGQSEERLKEALKVLSAIGGGRAFFIATSNKLSQLPPELKRRFKTGTFFMDLPNDDEQESIWELYLKRYTTEQHSLRIKDLKGVDYSGWTGAEIEQCCKLAWNLRKPLNWAAKFIVPVVRSSFDQIDQLRREAHETFLSSSYEGYYEYKESGMKAPEKLSALPAGGRSIDLSNNN